MKINILPVAVLIMLYFEKYQIHGFLKNIKFIDFLKISSFSKQPCEHMQNEEVLTSE